MRSEGQQRSVCVLRPAGQSHFIRHDVPPFLAKDIGHMMSASSSLVYNAMCASEHCIMWPLRDVLLPSPGAPSLVHIGPIQFPLPNALAQTVIITLGNIRRSLDLEHPQFELQECELRLVVGAVFLPEQRCVSSTFDIRRWGFLYTYNCSTSDSSCIILWAPASAFVMAISCRCYTFC